VEVTEQHPVTVSDRLPAL